MSIPSSAVSKIRAVAPFALAVIPAFASLWWVRSSGEEVSRALDVLIVSVGVLLGAIAEILIRLSVRETQSRSEKSLLDCLHNHPALLEPFLSVATAAARVQDADLPTTYDDHAAEALQRCTTELNLLATGHLYRRQGDSQMMLAALGAESELVLGITESADLPWWSSETGALFRAANIGVVRRGGKVRRVFILSGDTTADECMRAEMRLQSLSGISCYWVTQEQIPSDLYVNATVIGERIAHEDVVNGKAQTMEYRYMASRHDIARVRSRIEALIRVASPYEVASSEEDSGESPVVRA